VGLWQRDIPIQDVLRDRSKALADHGEID
jgi:hypothetical protein